MTIVPAAPPLPIAATSPFTHAWLTTPSDQLAIAVLQLPLPSTGDAGLAPLASQVSVWPSATLAQNAAVIAVARKIDRLPRLRAHCALDARCPTFDCIDVALHRSVIARRGENWTTKERHCVPPTCGPAWPACLPRVPIPVEYAIRFRAHLSAL